MGRSQADIGIEEIHARGRDDQRHDHRRDHEGHDRRFIRQFRTAQPKGRDGAQSGRDQRRKDRDDEAVLDIVIVPESFNSAGYLSISSTFVNLLVVGASATEI